MVLPYDPPQITITILTELILYHSLDFIHQHHQVAQFSILSFGKETIYTGIHKEYGTFGMNSLSFYIVHV
jgi:hypothetical protein